MNTTKAAGKSGFDWLKEGTFYIHGLVYMFVRVLVNVNMTLRPFYLSYVTGYGDSDDPTVPRSPSPIELALVPLTAYIMSLLFSLFVQQTMTRKLRNRFLPMLISILIITCASFPLYFLSRDTDTRWLVYPLAGF